MILPTKKQAQIEVIGLAVIVILLALGLFFVVSFKIQTIPEPVRQEFTTNQLADSFVTSLVKTDTPCGPVKSLLQDAAVHRSLQCENMDSRSYMEGVLEDMLEGTLGSWGWGYNLSIPRAGIELLKDDCTSDKPKQGTAYQPISAYPYGDIDIFLDVCTP